MKKSLIAAAESGDRRDILETMRDYLADAMENASPMVIAQIAARLQDVVRELDELPQSSEKSVSDELANRRALRRTAATNVRDAAGDSK